MKVNPHKIYFRARGNKSIGLGHFMRLLSLADMVKDFFDVAFVLNQEEEELFDQVNSQSFDKITIDASTVDMEVGMLEQQLSPGIFVVDGYDFSAPYFHAVKRLGHSTAYVDDFAQPMPYVDLLINHALGINEAAFDEGENKILAGPKYLLVRKPFLSAAKKKLVKQDLRKAFICFGGADTYSLTERILNDLLTTTSFDELHVVVAPTLTLSEGIINRIKDDSSVVVHQSLSADQMANVMTKCGVGFVPSSSLSLEACCCKMVLFSGYFVENQLLIHQGLVDHSCVKDLGDLRSVQSEVFVSLVKSHLEDDNAIEKQLDAQNHLFDGSSPDNLLSAFKELVL